MVRHSFSACKDSALSRFQKPPTPFKFPFFHNSPSHQMKLSKSGKQSRPFAQPIQNTFFPNSPSHQMKLRKSGYQSRSSAQPIQNS